MVVVLVYIAKSTWSFCRDEEMEKCPPVHCGEKEATYLFETVRGRNTWSWGIQTSHVKRSEDTAIGRNFICSLLRQKESDGIFCDYFLSSCCALDKLGQILEIQTPASSHSNW